MIGEGLEEGGKKYTLSCFRTVLQTDLTDYSFFVYFCLEAGGLCRIIVRTFQNSVGSYSASHGYSSHITSLTVSTALLMLIQSIKETPSLFCPSLPFRIALRVVYSDIILIMQYL